MRDETYQIIGLIGFIIAGVLFIIVGMNYGDVLTIAASIVWTISCIIMMIPLVKRK